MQSNIPTCTLLDRAKREVEAITHQRDIAHVALAKIAEAHDWPRGTATRDARFFVVLDLPSGQVTLEVGGVGYKELRGWGGHPSPEKVDETRWGTMRHEQRMTQPVPDRQMLALVPLNTVPVRELLRLCWLRIRALVGW